MSQALKGEVQTFYQVEASHWSFLLALFVGFYLSDQLYSIINIFAPKIVDLFNRFTGVYTYSVLISVFLLFIIKLTSKYMTEMNITHKPQPWVWITAILILSHPLLIFQNSERITVEFEIFGMIRRTLGGSDELFIVIFSSIIYIFASFGALQIMYLSKKNDKIESKKLSKLISVDLLPIIGIILIFLYFVQSLTKSRLEEIEYSNPIKIIIFIIFSYASIPNATSISRENETEKST